jgi:lactoylglutathione lyase
MIGGKASAKFAVPTDDGGMVLTLIRLDGQAGVRYPETFHFGFGQASPEQVDEINRRMKADDHDVPPPSRQHGAWTFYYKAPGGFVVEVLS